MKAEGTFCLGYTGDPGAKWPLPHTNLVGSKPDQCPIGEQFRRPPVVPWPPVLVCTGE